MVSNIFAVCKRNSSTDQTESLSCFIPPVTVSFTLVTILMKQKHKLCSLPQISDSWLGKAAKRRLPKCDHFCMSRFLALYP